MTNITFLYNIPEKINNAFRVGYANFFKDYKKEKVSYTHLGENQRMFFQGGRYLPPGILEYLNDLGFYKLQIWNLEEPSEPHYDIGRTVAFNFPIDCATDSIIYAAKNEHVDDILKTAVDRSIDADPLAVKKYPTKYSTRYLYNTEYYDSYGMPAPYIINTAVPHGGHSPTNTKRIFWTCSFKDEYTYNDILEKFQQWI